MKSSKTYVLLLLTATTLGGAVLAWRQYGELVELRAAALNRNERAELQKRVWDLEKLNRELRDQLAAHRNTGEPEGLLAEADNLDGDRGSRDRNSRGERGGDPRARGSSGLQQATAMRELMAKPEVQAMLSLQQRAAIDARYAALFRNLNLPGDQIDKLKTLLADRTTTIQDVVAAARDQGINPRENPEAFRKIVADAQNVINENIKSVIGEQGFAQLSTYEQTLPQRSVVNELQQRLSYTSTPLTAAQAEQMVQILAANAPQRAASAGPSGRPEIGDRGPITISRGPELGGAIVGTFAPAMGMLFDGVARGTAPVTSAAVSQSQTVLAPPQVAALQEIQQQQQSQQQLRQLMSETLNANRSTGGATSTAAGAPAPSTSNGPPTPRRRGAGG